MPIRTHITENEDSGTTLMTLRATSRDLPPGSAGVSRVEIEDRFQQQRISREEHCRKDWVRTRKRVMLNRRAAPRTYRTLFASKSGALPPMVFRKDWHEHTNHSYPDGIDHAKHTHESSSTWMNHFGPDRPLAFQSSRDMLVSRQMSVGGMIEGG